MDQLPIAIDVLLTPLEQGAGGGGVDLRADSASGSLYQKLKDIRFDIRTTEREIDKNFGNPDSTSPDPESIPPRWRPVLAMAQEALTSSSKDFEIACWMSEALVRLYGLQGLTTSALLIKGLCDRYWDTGFPSPDEDGSLEARAIPIGGLSGEGGDGTLVRPLRSCILFHRSDRTPANFALWDLARFTNSLPEERRAARLAAGAPNLETLKAEARADLGTLTETARSAAVALESWQAMDAALTERFGADAPSMRKITTLLEDILGIAELMGASPSAAGSDAAAESPAGGAAPPRASAPAEGGGSSAARTNPDAIRNREEALRDLDRIAAFFRQAEPHSPLSYTLQEAVRRGRMSFNELLAEVLPNEEARRDMLARLGLRVETEPEE